MFHSILGARSSMEVDYALYVIGSASINTQTFEKEKVKKGKIKMQLKFVKSEQNKVEQDLLCPG